MRADDPVVERLVEITLFTVLFADGMLVGFRDLLGAWRLPGRALLLGFPLTLGAVALLARFVAGVPWLPSLLLGAILAPTDPVFASALVGREEIPARVRRLLNVESGLNDGLALPIVLVLLASTGRGGTDAGTALAEAGLGLVVGVAVPLAVILLLRIPGLRASERYEPLGAFSAGLAVLGITSVTHTNEFLGAFAAGVTVATAAPELRETFHPFGETLTELLKLASLLVLGALLDVEVIAQVGWRGAAFALLVLVLARPAAIAMALLRTGLSRREQLTVAWFGPKGFASVAYALLVLTSGAGFAGEVFVLTAGAVGLSILLHSTTDVPITRAFFRRRDDGRR